MKSDGISVVFISHKLDEVFAIADRIMVMRDGTVVSVRPKEDVKEETLIEEMVGRKVENLYPKQKAPSLDTIIINLSGGNQQKVVLGKWLLAQPQILFMDEPTKGIDVGAKAEIYKLMNELAMEGYSIIMVSSDMLELVAMSDRCIVFSNSRITGEFSGEEITQENIMKAALSM